MHQLKGQSQDSHNNMLNYPKWEKAFWHKIAFFWKFHSIGTSWRVSAILVPTFVTVARRWNFGSKRDPPFLNTHCKTMIYTLSRCVSFIVMPERKPSFLSVPHLLWTSRKRTRGVSRWGLRWRRTTRCCRGRSQGRCPVRRKRSGLRT